MVNDDKNILIYYAVLIIVREADNVVNGDAGPGVVGDFKWFKLALGYRAGDLRLSIEVVVMDVSGDIFHQARPEV